MIWDCEKQPMTRHDVAAKMADAIDVAITLAREAGVPAHLIVDMLEQRANAVRQQDAMMKPIGY